MQHGPIRCPACQGQRLSPTGKVDASAARAYAYVMLRRDKQRFFSGPSVRVGLRASICGDCGFVALFAEPDDFAKLREQWTDLDWPATPAP